jgi:hypothetical protein
MRDSRAGLNVVAVSLLTRESAINEPQTMSAAVLTDAGDYFDLDARREGNVDEANGREEADLVYDLGATVSGTLNFNRLQPHQAALILAYGLGAVQTSAAGAGYRHTITPLAGDLDPVRSNPSFTAAQRLGRTIAKRRFASCFVDSFSLTFAADDWVKASAEIKGSGLVANTVIEEAVVAPEDTSSLTLSGPVQGATDQERLDSVQVVRAVIDGSMQMAAVHAVSADDPAVLTIDPLGAAGTDTTFKVLYSPPEPEWASFPERLTETPLRVSEACLSLGGFWTGSEFVGGEPVAGALRSFEWTCANNLSLGFTPCAGDDHAGLCLRGARVQTIKLSRELRNWMLQHYQDTNETFGLHLVCEGALFDDSHRYAVELVFPRLGVLSAPMTSEGGVVAEAGDLQVLHDPDHGTVIAAVQHQLITLAAAGPALLVDGEALTVDSFIVDVKSF